MCLIRWKQSLVSEYHSSFDRNITSLIIYKKNFIRFELPKNECIFHVTRVQITYSTHAVKISSVLTVHDVLFILTINK